MNAAESRLKRTEMRPTILNHVTFGLFTAALPDILGSVDIGMRFVSAPATLKVRLITAVALLTVAPLGARPAGVAPLDKLHRDSCPCRLISDLGRNCQLSEGLVTPRLLANPIAGPIGSLQATEQSVRVGTFELDCDPQSRNANIEPDQLNRLKGGGIRPGI